MSNREITHAIGNETVTLTITDVNGVESVTIDGIGQELADLLTDLVLAVNDIDTMMAQLLQLLSKMNIVNVND
jgi:hypothetical protein